MWSEPRTWDELLSDIRGGGERADDAAVAVGLLLEEPRDPDAIRLVLGDAFAEVELDADEREQLVDLLAGHVEDVRGVSPSVVWALGKDSSDRAVAALGTVVNAGVRGRVSDDIAYQAVAAVTAGRSSQAAAIAQRAVGIKSVAARSLALGWRASAGR